MAFTSHSSFTGPKDRGRETNRLSILLLVLQAADVFLFLTDIRKRKKMERNLMSVEQESKRYKL